MIDRGNYKYPIPGNEVDEMRQLTHAEYLDHRDQCLQCSAHDTWPYGGKPLIAPWLCKIGCRLYLYWQQTVSESENYARS